MKTVFDGIEHSVKNWWMSLILGILYIGVAICLMFAPLSSYVALSIVFSISMLISGILEILFAISNKHVSSWGWYLAGGIIDLIIGIYLVAYPMVSMEIIPFLIAFCLCSVVLCHRLFDGPQTVWHPRLGMVHGFRHSCHSLFAAHFVATGSRCIVCGLYDFIHLPYYRFLQIHARIRT